MTPELWNKVEELFHRAQECHLDERSAFLEQACAGNEALRDEVASLLSNPDEMARFLEVPAVKLAAEALAAHYSDSPIGRRIGAYQLAEEIGRGGMGAVYRAVRVDGQYQQQVAIKLVKRGMDTEWIVRHFRAERQILASLQHPNITRLLDGGTTEDGRPYFVMEYIEGRPLDEFCDSRRLPVTARLKLFRTVCSAVHYAHQRLVVHRDLKPSNILVTEEGAPKLLDFGIAKILSDRPAEPAATILPMLTPDYASPEQVRGEPVTTASDVYALGVVLYELLSGHRPYRFQTQTAEEMVRVVCEREPEKPSAAVTRTEEVPGADGGLRTITPESVRATRKENPGKLRHRLAGDLDKIVLKAIRKEPERRYSSVDQFSDDIGRYLGGLPVIARKDTLGYRGAKYLRRHKAGVAAAGLLVMSLAAGMFAALWQARVADRRFQDVRRLANAVVFEFHDAIQDLPGSTPARLLLVKRALEYLDSLAREAHGDVDLQRELAAAYEKMGDVQGRWGKANLGDPAGALASYRKALAIRQAMTQTPGNPQLRRELARAYSNAAAVLESTNQTGAALESYRRAMAIREALAAGDRSNIGLQKDLAISHLEVAGALDQGGDRVAALADYRKALPLFEAVSNRNPKDQADRRNVALAHKKLGAILFYQDLTESLEHYRKAAVIEEAVCAESPMNADARLDLSFTYCDTGLVLRKSGDRAGALESYRKALAIRENLAAADPQNQRARGALASVCYRMGQLEADLGETAAGLRSARRALSMIEERATARGATAEQQAELAAAHASVGYVLGVMAMQRGSSSGRRAQSWREARDSYQRAVDIFVRLRKSGTLSGYRTPDLESAQRELAACDAALMRIRKRESGRW